MDKKINVLNKTKTARCIATLLAVVVTVTMSSTIALAAGKKKPIQIKEPTISAGSYVVMSGSTSEEVYAVHADRKMPMGNIAKLMTAMVVIDNIHDNSEYSNSVEIDENLGQFGSEFKAGDSVRIKDLITALIVGNSDQAAEALASYSASDRGIFISEMNSKAMEIGLMSTQYTNPTGAYNNDQYSTAAESAIVAQYAMRYERIKNLMIKDTALVRVGGADERTVTFTSTNPLLCSAKAAELYPNITGGAMSTLEKPDKFAQYVGVASKDGMQLIVAMLEAKPDKVATEAIELFEYGYSKVTKNQLIKEDKAVGKVRIKGGAKTKLTAYTETKGYAYIPPEGSTDLVSTETVIFDGIEAPIKKGAKVGEYRIYVADELKGTVDLVVKQDVKKGWIFSKIYISNFAVVMVVLIFSVLAFVILRLRAINKRKARIRAMKKRERIREEARKQEALDMDRKMRKWTYSKYYDSFEMQEAIKSSKKKNKKT